MSAKPARAYVRIATGLRTLTLSTMRRTPGRRSATKSGRPASARVAMPRPWADASTRKARSRTSRASGARTPGGRAAVEDEEPDGLAALEDRDRLAVRVGLGGGQRLGQAARETLLVRPRREAQEPVAQIRAHRGQSDVHGHAG